MHLIDRTLLTFKGEKGERIEAIPCPGTIWESLRSYREGLLLTVAEMDDALAEQVLAEEEPAAEQVWAALRQATLQGRVYPCFAGSALRNQGVQPLMDAVVKLLPAPTERPPAIAQRLDGGEESVAMDPKARWWPWPSRSNCGKAAVMSSSGCTGAASTPAIWSPSPVAKE